MVNEDIEKKQYSALQHIFHRILHYLEFAISGLTLAVLLVALVRLAVEAFTDTAMLSDFTQYLHHALNLVVGLEFVRMLVDTTPASILEVLTLAITRYLLLNHEDPWSIVAGVACIAGLFAVRRFLFTRAELEQEMTDDDDNK